MHGHGRRLPAGAVRHPRRACSWRRPRGLARARGRRARATVEAIREAVPTAPGDIVAWLGACIGPDSVRGRRGRARGIRCRGGALLPRRARARWSAQVARGPCPHSRLAGCGGSG
jgi:hypothetical protein